MNVAPDCFLYLIEIYSNGLMPKLVKVRELNNVGYRCGARTYICLPEENTLMWIPYKLTF